MLTPSVFLGDPMMDILHFPMIKSFEIDLVDTGSSSGEQTVTVAATRLGIMIQPAGHNDPNGSHSPVFIRFADGDLFITIWADINADRPTHCISLAGAREDRRR